MPGLRGEVAARWQAIKRAGESALLLELLKPSSQDSNLTNTHSNNKYKFETKPNEVAKWKRGPRGAHRKVCVCCVLNVLPSAS